MTLLTGHLVEDELHGRLNYIDRALAVVGAAEVYKTEIGMSFTQSQLAQKLTHDGYPISQPTISQMMDTVNYLLPVIPEQLNAGMSRTLIEKVLRLRKIAKIAWNKQDKINNIDTEQSYTFDNLFTEVLSQYNNQPLDLNKYQDELIGRIATIFECSYELIELEFNEKLARQRSLETPSNALEDDFDEASLFANNRANVDTQDEELDVSQILAITAPRRPLTPTVTRKTVVDDANEPPSLKQEENIHHGLDEFASNTTHDDTHQPVVQNNSIETTPRLEEIKQLINQYNHNVELDSSEIALQVVPVQTVDIFPLSDILYIQDELNQIDILRKHIGQLLIEIIQTISDETLIELTNDQLGFNCTQSFSENKSVQTLIDLLQALSNKQQTIDNEALHKQISLLTGLQSQSTEVIRLDDTSFSKLMRVFRLIRHYVELYNNKGG